ncbi:MAG TPA: hypothetical protein VM120_15070 [Bryobacteraceae bacterium]|nr:hypothetical protein [Bryobacteraceae bacterium]
MVVSELLYTALRLAGMFQLSGRTSSTTELADAFAALNALVDGWNADGLTIFAIEKKVCTLAASTSLLHDRPGRDVRVPLVREGRIGRRAGKPRVAPGTRLHG